MATLEKRATASAEEKGTLVPISRHLEDWPSRLMERFERFLGERESFFPSFHLPEVTAFRMPAMDVYEDQDAIVVETELPGMKKEEIEVKLSGDLLTISGKHQREEKVERKNYLRVERSASAVSRSIRLPVDVQADKMTAHLKDGVLEIRAPKADASKAGGRTVPVT
jgi:HSP20 family protein